MFLGDNILELKLNELKTKKFKKIIAFIDGSETAEKAMKKAILLARSLNINIEVIYMINTATIVRVFPHQDRVISPQQLEIAANLKKQACSSLYNIEKVCNKLEVKVTTKIVEDVPFVDITKKAGRDDLIVMGCNKSLYSTRLFFHSVSEKILQHAQSTVMFVR